MSDEVPYPDYLINELGEKLKEQREFIVELANSGCSEQNNKGWMTCQCLNCRAKRFLYLGNVEAECNE